MSKIFFLFLAIFSIFSCNFAYSAEYINIISREEWGANEDYKYLDSKEWIYILEKNKKNIEKNLSKDEKKQILLKANKVKIANNFLIKNYPEIHQITSIEQYENGHKLAWPIAKSKIKNSIVIHHTDTKIENSYDAIKNIYKYHSLTKQWGDIGYNYLIGFNGEIFEGRTGGDLVVGAHDKWNNQFSIGIGVIGNYQNKPVNQKQLESIEKLIKYLLEKHNIDITEKVSNFKWCVGEEKCDTKPIIVSEDYPLIGHRDAGYTSCPGEELYKQLISLRKKILIEYKSDKYYILKQKLSKINEYKLINFLAIIEEKIDKTSNTEKLIILNKIKKIILDIENKKIDKYLEITEKSFDDNNKIKVKLSYPYDDYINLKISGNYIPFLSKKDNEYILEFKKGKKYRTYSMNFKFFGDKLYLNNKEILHFNNKSFFRIKGIKNKYLIINSWDRKPSWDNSGLYNDNKFRGDIIFYKKNSKLIVVNELLLNNYLKGLGEVSNSTNKEKIKSVVVLARSYARWYMIKAEKFMGEWYQASDNPNIFQKYLGYGLEERSPIINDIVEETKDVIITYNGNLIKPWYFSSSNGYTRNFLDFCKESKGVSDCLNPQNFPFLVGVKDIAGEGKKQRGHGIGVPGTGMEYFSNRGWNFNMIIKYFLKGVEIKKM